VTVGDRRIPVRVDISGELAEVDGQAVLWDRSPCWLGGAPVAGPAGVPWQVGGSPLTPDWQGTPAGPPGGDRDEWGAPALVEPGIGFRGELEFAGLTWLRHRVYDPSSRAFLSPDPLPPVPGTAWSGNPYHYAGNDPVGRADPLGLRPITDAELAAYRDEMGSGFFEDAADWVGDNWEYLAAGAMIVGGVALMFTGVGGPAGIALMAASGGLIAGGASAGIQKFTTGEVDWGQVGTDALVGAVTGAAGAGAVAALGSTARLAATSPFVRELALNGAESLISGGVERGLTGGNVFNPRALATDLLTGGAVPAPAGGLGAPTRLADPLEEVRIHSSGNSPGLPELNRRDPVISVEDARAAAERQNLDTRSIDIRLRREGDPGYFEYGYGSTVFQMQSRPPYTETPVRGPDGRFIVELQPSALQDELTAAMTVSHELYHLRTWFRGGDVHDEAAAETAAEVTEMYYRP
jgi:RHS repeat-associated protein